jgi:hypothetical protein
MKLTKRSFSNQLGTEVRVYSTSWDSKKQEDIFDR